MSETPVNLNGVHPSIVGRNTEVVPRSIRRRFTKAYVERILKELDDAPHGEKGKILRREGLYTKTITKWKKDREQGTAESKRGRKASPQEDLRKRIDKLEREAASLKRKLYQAEKIIEVQKKYRSFWGLLCRTRSNSNGARRRITHNSSRRPCVRRVVTSSLDVLCTQASAVDANVGGATSCAPGKNAE